MLFPSLHVLSQVFWRQPQYWPVAVLVAMALLGAILVCYPGQLGLVPWPWRGVLPVLRIIAVVALAASLLKPIVMRPATAEERGAVLVLVDRSRSMAVVDNARTWPQLVALADALGKLPPKVRNNSATALAADLERLRTSDANVRAAQEDLDYARVSGRDIQVRQAHLRKVADEFATSAKELSAKAAVLAGADDLTHRLNQLAHPPDVGARDAWRGKVPEEIASALTAIGDYQENRDAELHESNAEVRKACDEVKTLSRFSLVERALLRPGGLVDSAPKDMALKGFTVAGEIEPLELKRGDKPAETLKTSPNGSESDLTDCIAQAVNGRAVRAVVLLSDGRQVGGNATIVSGLTPNGVPIFTVNAAAAAPPHDVSFATVQAPSSVFAGQSVRIKAELRHEGFDGETVNVHCKIADEPEQQHKITLHENKPALAEFTAEMKKAGAQPVVLWFDAIKNEASTENDRVERQIKVVAQPMKVLLVAGAPTWDYQYARNALGLRLAAVKLSDVVLDPSNPKLPTPPREILEQDVIVLFDVPVSACNEGQWDAIERVVHDAGGSVILVAGDGHLPTEEYYRYTFTATLLPFRAPFSPVWKTFPEDNAGFHFVPASDSESLDLLRLPLEKNSEDADAAARRWEQLPGMFRYLQLPEVRDKSWKPQAHALLVEEESRLPVLTEMRKGAGRAFFLGLNETWRWRYKVGERDQEYFWRQLIQHASEDPYFAHNGPLALDTDKISAEPDEEIHVRARLTEELPAPPGGAFFVVVLRDGKEVAQQPLTPTDVNAGGRFSATLKLPAGKYVLRWSAADAKGRKYAVEMPPLTIEQTPEKELADLSGDRRMLRKLAEASGGEYLTLDQIDRLPERLAAVGSAGSRFVELSLWDSAYLFALVVGCFGAEWALRKRVGLA